MANVRTSPLALSGTWHPDDCPPHGFQRVRGRASCGKRVARHPLPSIQVSTSSSIIQEIETLHDTGLALMTYFYCDFKATEKQDVTGLLASFLAQLSAKSDPCCDIVAALYSKYDAGSRQPNEDAFIECLENMLRIEGQPPIYL